MKKLISFALAVSMLAGLLGSGISVSADNNTELTPSNTSGTLEITLKIKADIQPSVTLEGWMYGEEANTPSVTGNDGNGEVTYYYKAKDADDSAYTEIKPTAAGNYTVKAEIAETDDYKSGSATADFTIANYSTTLTITLVIKEKATATAPTAKELTYNGQAQALVTAGEATGGTMQYKLGADGAYSENIPTATNAGSYTVYYKAVGDSDHQDSDEDNLTVVINKATPAAPVVTGTNETVKNKNDGTITGVDSTMEYKKQGDENYTAISGDKLENLSVGTYLVRYKADDNRNASTDTTVVIGEGETITVVFEANGGSEVDEITGLSYGDKITEPEEPTRDKFYFAGWYKDKDCTELWSFNNDTVTEKDTTLYAKWSAIPTHTIKGIVYANDTVTPKPNVKVSLVKGNKIIGTTKTDDKGEFNIIALEDTYNIIATDEKTDITKTELVELKADTEIKVVMPDGQKESILDNTDAGDFEAVVGGLDAIAEKETVKAGEKVTLKLAIRDDDAASSSAEKEEFEEAKTAISESTEAKGKTLDYFDLTLTKTVTDTENGEVKRAEKYTITDKSLIKVKLTTYNSAGKTNISLIRYTDSGIEEITTTPNENGEYIEIENDGSLTIHVAEIAPYAISYTTPTKRSGGSGGSSTYAITAEKAENGKVKTSVSSAVKGKEVKITATPDEGYELDTVTVTDKDGKTVEVTRNEDSTYSFTMPASKVTVTPVFKEASAEPTTSPAPTTEPQATDKPSGDKDWWFKDVPESSWYYAPIKEAFDAERMSGMSEDYFEPETDITRGMFAYAIYRREGLPETDAQNKFEDVKADTYYEKAIAWATENGIVSGYDDTHYAPDEQITREQMAAVLYRYAQFKAYDVSVGEDTNILDFTDAPDISEYAIPAIQWAVGDSVITGFEDGSMLPKANANRAQMAVILNKIADLF